MRKVLEVLRLRLGEGLSERATAQSVGKSRSTVSEYVERFRAAGLTWPLGGEVDEAALEARLFPARPADVVRVMPDAAMMDVELRRKGVTLQLLWTEYAEEHGERAYQYSHFCEVYQRWRRKQRLSMRQLHVGGEKLFVDFSGDGPCLTDIVTGQKQRVSLFVAALGASSLTYACATPDETLASWLEGMTGALEAFGGVPRVVVPDNPRALVTRVDRHEPELNRTVDDWASHYGTCVMPARPYRPKDKAKVEAAVLVAQRWIVAVLRNETFHTLGELNAAISALTARLNARVMKHLGCSRAQLFEELERAALKALPVNRFEFCAWHKARVHSDYHVQVEKHFYSVPYVHRGEEVMVRVKSATVEVLVNGVCVATHARSKKSFGYSTRPEHMPPAHRASQLNGSVEDVRARAERVGPDVAQFFDALMDRRPHPEHAIKSMLGILAMTREFPDTRINAACARALRFKTLKTHAVKNILRQGLDSVPAPTDDDKPMPSRHVHLRGGTYFLH